MRAAARSVCRLRGDVRPVRSGAGVPVRPAGGERLRRRWPEIDRVAAVLFVRLVLNVWGENRSETG